MKYKVEVLSPVHVGSGYEISPMEYVIDNKFYRVDMDSLFRDETFNTDDFIENAKFGAFYLGKFYREVAKKHKKYVVEMTDSAKHSLENKKTEVREYIKTGGRIYIPGSSIKGSIRTAILWHILKENAEMYSLLEEYLEKLINGDIRQPKRKYVANKIEETVFGKDPNHDLLKALMVSDTTTASFDTLSIEDVHILSTKRYGYQWKGFTILLEALSVGALFEMDIKKDSFFTNGAPGQELGFDDKSQYLDNLKDICNSYARDFIEYELQFLRRYDDGNLNEVIRFYEELGKGLKIENGLFLHISWGAGWHGMTIGGGVLIDENIMEELRIIYGMGKIIHSECGGKVIEDRRNKGKLFCTKCKRGSLDREDIEIVKPFPKTRKFVFENGKPKYPLGWIRLEEIK